MKPQELRIGNWVSLITNQGETMVDGFEKTTKIKSIGYDLLEQHYECLITSGYVVSIKQIEPIPLTEEWLLNFGFEKDAYMTGFWHNDNIELQLIGGQLLININGDLIGKPLEYVHSLQNLYFALTGEELTI